METIAVTLVICLAVILFMWFQISKTRIKKLIIDGETFYAEEIRRFPDNNSETRDVLEFYIKVGSSRIVDFRTIVPIGWKNFELCFYGDDKNDPTRWFLVEKKTGFEYDYEPEEDTMPR